MSGYMSDQRGGRRWAVLTVRRVNVKMDPGFFVVFVLWISRLCDPLCELLYDLTLVWDTFVLSRWTTTVVRPSARPVSQGYNHL